VTTALTAKRISSAPHRRENAGGLYLQALQHASTPLEATPRRELLGKRPGAAGGSHARPGPALRLPLRKMFPHPAAATRRVIQGLKGIQPVDYIFYVAVV